jgi:hypothetical protein
MHESVYVVWPFITLEVSPPGGEERPVQESPFEPVTVQLWALLTLQETFVVAPAFTMLGERSSALPTVIAGYKQTDEPAEQNAGATQVVTFETLQEEFVY